VFKVISEVLPREYAHLRVDRADIILHRLAPALRRPSIEEKGSRDVRAVGNKASRRFVRPSINHMDADWRDVKDRIRLTDSADNALSKREVT
jgi:hypothetical protein